MKRAIRAFLRALGMTLRGESFAPAHFQPLLAWMDAVEAQLRVVLHSAEQQGLNQSQRQALQLKLDGRMTSLEQSLQMLRHNLKNEYPRLIRLNDSYSMMVVQSLNLNDQYRISRFLADGGIKSGALRQSLADLNERLLNLPQVNYPPGGDSR